MEEENITTDKVIIVREVNVGGHIIPYEISIDTTKLPKGNEDFYLDILTKLL